MTAAVPEDQRVDPAPDLAADCITSARRSAG
jgi:hypothetical protein